MPVSRRRLLSALLTGLLLVACGGGAGPDGPVSPAEPAAGRLWLDNRTPWEVEAAWLTDAALHRVAVASGRAAALTDTLPAETVLALDLVLQVPADSGPRVRRKADVVIDGDRTLVVSASAADPFDAVLDLLDAPPE